MLQNRLGDSVNLRKYTPFSGLNCEKLVHNQGRERETVEVEREIMDTNSGCKLTRNWLKGKQKAAAAEFADNNCLQRNHHHSHRAKFCMPSLWVFSIQIFLSASRSFS